MIKHYLLVLLAAWIGFFAIVARPHKLVSNRDSIRHAAGQIDKDPRKATAIGLRADYFVGVHFEKQFLRRTDERVDFHWTRHNRPPGVNDLLFSVRWTGKVLAPVTGVYRFVVTMDDGVRLWIGGTLLLEKWKEFYRRPTFTYITEKYLEAGQQYDLRLEYFNFYNDGNIQLYWEVPKSEIGSRIGIKGHHPRSLIPRENLFSAPLPPEEELMTLAEPAKDFSPKGTISSKGKPSAGSKKKETNRKPALAKSHDGLMPMSGNTAPEIFSEKEDFRKPEIGKTLVLRNVLFEQSKYILLPESYSELDRLVRLLQQYPAVTIEVAGHTDNVGDAGLNQLLSEQRAQVVTTYLIRKGIAADRIQTHGYGGTKPIADNTVESERPKNRRVTFTVLSE